MWDLATLARLNREHVMAAVTDDEIAAWRAIHSLTYHHDSDDEIRGYIADDLTDTDEEYS